MSVCLSICSCACVCTDRRVWRQKVDRGIFLTPRLPYFLRQDLPLNPELSISVECLARKPPNAPGIFSPGLRFQAHDTRPNFYVSAEDLDSGLTVVHPASY